MKTVCKNCYNWMVYLSFKGLYQINKAIFSCKIEIEIDTDTEKTI